MALEKRAAATEEIERMEKAGIIERSTSPWASPVVLVKKKSGDWRFCLDYRLLNNTCYKDAYPLPRIDDCLDAVRGSSWFSTLDLASGYWQVSVHPDDWENVTMQGLHQFKVMPFGLANAPATFERLMEIVLAGLQWEICLIYLDDIMVFAQNFEEHMSRLSLVLDRVRQAGLKISPEKCDLFKKEVAFLGHIVGKEGISTDPKKIEAVSEWPRPKNATEIRSFLGLCSYYRKFMKGFADIAKSLHRLTEKDSEFHWTEHWESLQHPERKVDNSPYPGIPLGWNTFHSWHWCQWPGHRGCPLTPGRRAGESFCLLQQDPQWSWEKLLRHTTGIVGCCYEPEALSSLLVWTSCSDPDWPWCTQVAHQLQASWRSAGTMAGSGEHLQRHHPTPPRLSAQQQCRCPLEETLFRLSSLSEAGDQTRGWCRDALCHTGNSGHQGFWFNLDANMVQRWSETVARRGSSSGEDSRMAWKGYTAYMGRYETRRSRDEKVLDNLERIRSTRRNSLQEEIRFYHQ